MPPSLRWLCCLGLSCLLLATPAGAHAEEAPPESADPPAEYKGPRAFGSFGIGVTLLREFGFGGMAVLRHRAFELRLAGGYNGFFLFTKGDCDKDFHFGGAYQLMASGTWYLTRVDDKLDVGIALGGGYHELYGPGGSIGATSEIAINEIFALNIGGGFQFYPVAPGRVQDEVDRRCDHSNARARVPDFFAIMQFYTGLHVIAYLF